MDGFKICIFQQFWDLCKRDLFIHVEEVRRTGRMPGGGIGGLQQRKKRPESFDRFIPISLTLYIKSHPKMIAARSETMKNIFIFFEQGAFLKVKVGLLH